MKGFAVFLVVLLVAAAIALGVYLFVKKRKKDAEAAAAGLAPGSAPGTGTAPGSSSSSSSSSSSPLKLDIVLEKGSKGPEVKELQRLMAEGLGVAVSRTPSLIYRDGYPGPIAVDGSFGPKTEGALIWMASVPKITLRVAQSKFTNYVAPS